MSQTPVVSMTTRLILIFPLDQNHSIDHIVVLADSNKITTTLGGGGLYVDPGTKLMPITHTAVKLHKIQLIIRDYWCL